MTVFGGGQLASVHNLQSALRNVEKDLSGGTAILKFAKGDWSYGSNATEPEEGQLWAVNPYSFMHGFIAWGIDSNVLGEEMISMAEDINSLRERIGDPPAESLEKNEKGEGGRGWQRQSGVLLKCIEGPQDIGVEVRFTSSSDGGRRAVQQLAVDISNHIDIDPEHPVPVVELKTGSYEHKNKRVGRVKFPAFKIVEWMSLDGLKDEEDVSEDAHAPEEVPVEVVETTRRRRRRA